MANAQTPDDEHDLSPLLDVQQNQLSQIMTDSNGVDAKALAILAANIAILIFIAQSGLHAAVWKFALVYGPLALSFVLDMLAIWPRKYLGTIDLHEAPEYLQMNHDQLLLQLLADTQAAIDRNDELNGLRLRYSIVSSLLTSFGFLALLVIL